MEDLKNIRAAKMGVIQFKAFKSVLPKGIGLSDIDGELERHRWFLRLEKKKVGSEVSEGQRILLEHLSDLPEFTVVLFWGSEFNPKSVEHWCGRHHRQVPSLLDFIGSWWQWANKQPNAPRRD